jgi:hypothetical protein
LYYIHTDHLGSTSLMSDADGQKVETSVARYLPYGRWRTEPTADLTDRAYTGQKAEYGHWPVLLQRALLRPRQSAGS